MVPKNTKKVKYKLSAGDYENLKKDRAAIVEKYCAQLDRWMDIKLKAIVNTPPKRKIVYKKTSNFSTVRVQRGLSIFGFNTNDNDVVLAWKPNTSRGWNSLGYLMNKSNLLPDFGIFTYKKATNDKPALSTIIVRDDDYIFKQGHSNNLIAFYFADKNRIDVS